MRQCIVFVEGHPKVILSDNSEYLGKKLVVSLKGVDFEFIKESLFNIMKNHETKRSLLEEINKTDLKITDINDIMIIEQEEEIDVTDIGNIIILGNPRLWR